MLILVDYDNISFNISRNGLLHIANVIVSKLDVFDVQGSRNILLRLYGGWYEKTAVTQRAQNLSSEILQNFPSVAVLSDGQTNVIVNCEMAFSLISDPSNHLFNTYRQKGKPSGLKAKHPSAINCSDPNCPIITTYNFLNNNVCPKCNTVKPEDVFYRGEQKLVDTMITADLIFSSIQGDSQAIVSSDDDFWPGIKTTLVLGKRIIHFHTKNRRTSIFYTRTTKGDYIQKQL